MSPADPGAEGFPDNIVTRAPSYAIGPLKDATDDGEAIARDISAVGRLEAVPTLLEVLCEITGMGFAAVARVTDKTWTACAVKDEAHFGLKPGMEVPLNMTLCFDSRASHALSMPRLRHPERLRDNV